jgi:hypothetical protein
MGAIVQVAFSGDDDAFGAFLNLGRKEGISLQELGKNSGMYEVVFSSTQVAVGTGFETLQRILEEAIPGAGASVTPVPWG